MLLLDLWASQLFLKNLLAVNYFNLPPLVLILCCCFCCYLQVSDGFLELGEEDCFVLLLDL